MDPLTRTLSASRLPAPFAGIWLARASRDGRQQAKPAAEWNCADMLSLTDERWAELQGGYRVPYDPRPALARLEKGDDIAGAWDELWEQLLHQGDVGTASYAAVPHLVRVHQARGVADWNTFALVGWIEQARRAGRNPEVPEWLQPGYDAAWQELVKLARDDLSRSEDPMLVQSALAIIAMGRGLRRAGEVLLDFTDDELQQMLEKHRGEPTAQKPAAMREPAAGVRPTASPDVRQASREGMNRHDLLWIVCKVAGIYLIARGVKWIPDAIRDPVRLLDVGVAILAGLLVMWVRIAVPAGARELKSPAGMHRGDWFWLVCKAVGLWFSACAITELPLAVVTMSDELGWVIAPRAAATLLAGLFLLFSDRVPRLVLQENRAPARPTGPRSPRRTAPPKLSQGRRS